MNIIQGTTPTIKIEFPYDPEEIDDILVSFRCNGKRLEKWKEDLSFITEEETNWVVVTLSEEETAKLDKGLMSFRLRYRIGNKTWKSEKMWARIEED